MEENQRPRHVQAGFLSKENLPKLIAIAAAVVVVAVLLIALLAGSGPKAVAKKYVMNSLAGNVDASRKLLAYDSKEYLFDYYGDEEDFYEKMGDRYDEDIESWKDYCKAVAAYYKENYEDEYGKYKITAEVTKVKDLSEKKLKEAVGDGLFERYEDFGLDEDKISKGAEVTVKARIDGEDDDAKFVYTVYLGKIGGSWKVLKYTREAK